jgi:hypothetical protein
LSLKLARWDLPRYGISLMIRFDLVAGATATTSVVGWTNQMGRTMSFGARVFLLLVPLVTALNPAAAHAAESRDFAGWSTSAAAATCIWSVGAPALPRSC